MKMPEYSLLIPIILFSKKEKKKKKRKKREDYHTFCLVLSNRSEESPHFSLKDTFHPLHAGAHMGKSYLALKYQNPKIQ